MISRIVRQAKTDGVGTSVADINVCGALPPYNEILAGKLVALLLASPEVVSEYRRRYGKIPSVIASERMAKHSLVHPIRHGARIVLPRTDLDQPEFGEWRVVSGEWWATSDQ